MILYVGSSSSFSFAFWGSGALRDHGYTIFTIYPIITFLPCS